MLKYIAKALIIHRNELETYMLEPIEHADVENANFDILAWWKMKSGKYPILARMSRDILAVPISTVASEAAFSVGGRTLSAVRNSLKDDSLEALICAQDWLRSSITGKINKIIISSLMHLYFVANSFIACIYRFW